MTMNNDKWVEAKYEFSGLFLAPDEQYVRDLHKGYVLTFIGEPEPFQDWFWFKFTGEEA